jgi:hypothetical protein
MFLGHHLIEKSNILKNQLLHAIHSTPSTTPSSRSIAVAAPRRRGPSRASRSIAVAAPRRRVPSRASPSQSRWSSPSQSTAQPRLAVEGQAALRRRLQGNSKSNSGASARESGGERNSSRCLHRSGELLRPPPPIRPQAARGLTRRKPQALSPPRLGQIRLAVGELRPDSCRSNPSPVHGEFGSAAPLGVPLEFRVFRGRL